MIGLVYSLRQSRSPFIRHFSKGPGTTADFIEKLHSNPTKAVWFIKENPNKKEFFESLTPSAQNKLQLATAKCPVLAREYVAFIDEVPLNLSKMNIDNYVRASMRYISLSKSFGLDIQSRLLEMHKVVGSKFIGVNAATLMIYTSIIRKITDQEEYMLTEAFAKALHLRIVDFIRNPTGTQPYFCLFNLTKVEEHLMKYNLSMKPSVLRLIRLLSNKNLKDKPFDELHSLLNAVMSLFFNESLPDLTLQDKSDLFETASQVIERRLNLEASTVSAEMIYNFLRIYVMMDKGSEDFRRTLESNLFSRLSELAEDKFTNLMYLYHKRIVFDVRYINLAVKKPYHDNFVKRIRDGMKPEPLIDSLYKFSTCPARYGIYCEMSLIEALKEKLYDEDYLSQMKDNELKGKFYSHLITFLSLVSYFNDSQVVVRIADLFLRSEVSDYHLMCFTASFVKHCIYHEGIWGEFKSRFSSMLLNSTNTSFVFTIMETIKCLQHDLHNGVELYTELSTNPSYVNCADRIANDWKMSRSKDLDKNKRPFMHSNLEALLAEHNIPYVSEYFDDYYIDIAIPDRKLAIEFNGPPHYLYPGCYLNGKTSHKYMILEKLGWKVLEMSYHKRKLSESQQLRIIFKHMPLKV